MKRFFAFVLAFLSLSTAALADPDVCMFPIIGQSNASGNGNAAQSIPAPFSTAVVNGNSIGHANDPLCPTCNGSPWPQAAAQFYDETGATVYYVPSAYNGGILSSAYAAIVGTTAHWGATGTLVEQAFTKIDAALALLHGYGTEARVCGIFWSQGESEGVAAGEGVNLNNGRTVAQDWRYEFVNLKARFRAKYGASLPFFMSLTGTVGNNYSTRGYTFAQIEPGMAKIRLEQEREDEVDSRMIIASRMALECQARWGLVDEIHYTQECNNLMGREFGHNVAASGLWRQPE